jgi:BASS family bile acid:Na+ symporter
VTTGEAIRLALPASIWLLVFATGLHAEHRHAIYFFRNPGELGRALLAIFIVMPLLALSMARTFELAPAVKIALVAFALSPVPPLMPTQVTKVSRATDYTIGLLVAASVLSIAIIPLAMLLIDRTAARHLGISPIVIAKQMSIGILAPLALGMTFRRFAVTHVDGLARIISTIAMVVLAVCLVLILVASRHALGSLLGNGAVLAIAVLVTAGLATGHLLGGPDPEHRSVLAIATSVRHPGIAIAIAHTNFPEQKLAGAAVLLCLLVGAVVVTAYRKWASSKRSSHTIRERRV